MQRVGKVAIVWPTAARVQAERIAHLGFWRWEIASDVVTWSDELYRNYGTTRAGPGVSFEDYLDRVHPDDRSA